MFSRRQHVSTNGAVDGVQKEPRRSSLASTVASTIRRMSISSSISTVPADADIDDENLHTGPPPCSLLIECHSWDALREVLVDADATYVQEDCIMHSACLNHAPLDVVKAIYKLRPECLQDVDGDDRYPLHYAAAAWCEPPIIKFLLRRYPGAASEQDCDAGRTPLHLCVSPDDITNGHRRLSTAHALMSSKEPPIVRIIHYLCCVSPASAKMEDDEEYSPIELAIMSELPLLAVQVLRKASETAWKREESNRRATMPMLSARRSSPRAEEVLREQQQPQQQQPEAAAPVEAEEDDLVKKDGESPRRRQGVVRREALTIRRCSAKSA